VAEAAEVWAVLAQLLANLAKDRVLAFVVAVALICVLKSLPAIDRDVRCASTWQVSKLLIDDAIDDRADDHALRPEVMVRDGARNVPLFDAYVLEANAKGLAKLKQHLVAYLNSSFVHRLQRAVTP